MERIKTTPMVFGYVATLRFFLILWLVTLPISLIGAYGWLSPLILSGIAYLFLNIEQVASRSPSPLDRTRAPCCRRPLSAPAPGSYPPHPPAIARTIDLAHLLAPRQMSVEIEGPFGFDANDIPIEELVMSLEQVLMGMRAHNLDKHAPSLSSSKPASRGVFDMAG